MDLIINSNLRSYPLYNWSKITHGLLFSVHGGYGQENALLEDWIWDKIMFETYVFSHH